MRISDWSSDLCSSDLRIAEGNPLLGWFADDWMQTTIAMIATLLVILLVGWLARRVIGQRLLGWFEALVARVPLANTIYGSARRLLDFLPTKPDGPQPLVPDRKSVVIGKSWSVRFDLGGRPCTK